MATDVIIKIGAQVDEATAAIKKVQVATQEMSAQMTGHLGSVSASFGKLTGAIGAMTGILAGGAAFKDIVKTTTEWNTEALKLSRALGITTEQASAYRVTMARLGVDQEVVTGALIKMARTAANTPDNFKRIGVAVTDSNNNLLSASQILQNFITRMGEYQTGSSRTAAASLILGRQTEALGSIMKLTSAEIEKGAKIADEWGLTVSGEAGKATVEYKKKINELNLASTAFKVNVGNEMIPLLLELAKAFTEVGTAAAKGFGSVTKSASESKIFWAMVGRKAVALGNGGPLGMNWWTSSGRAEIGAEMTAADQMYAYQMEQLAEKRGGLTTRIVAARTPAVSGSLMGSKFKSGGAAGNASAGFSGTRITPDEAAAIKWLEEAVKRDNEMYAVFAESYLAMQETSAKLGGLKGKLDTGGKPSLMGSVDLLASPEWDTGAANRAAMNAANDAYIGRSFMAQTDRTGQLQLQLELDNWRKQWETAWAMNTDSFETYNARMLAIQTEYAKRKRDLDRFSAVQALDATGQLMGNIAGILMQGNRRAFEIGKGFAIAQAVIDTISGAQKAYTSMVGIPYVGPVLAAVAAGVAVAGGMARVAQIESTKYEPRELGGPVLPGGAYLVGEKGPELLHMGSIGGTITPNSALGKRIEVTNVYQISTGVSETVQAEIMRFAPAMAAMSVQAVEQAINSGTSLSRAVGRM